MITEIGHFSLILALCVAVLQVVVPLAGASRNDPALTAWARPAALTQFLFVGVAFLALTNAYIVSDFSVANVAANSNSMKPLIYKISGVWSNHEGSMLLWVFILALFGAAVAVFGRNLPPGLRARVLAVQAMIGSGFLLFILLTSNPFQRQFPVPADGAGLNPILQDPGLAFHPPFLYLGYVGFSIAFCFAIAALIEGRVDPAWARWVRPWTLAAWCALTVGIAMGSWWSYYTLGWGGWWFWDPVENASFMPWLVGTALLHSAVVVEKRDALKTWTVLLAILAFSLSLLGTFLVRSGVLTSVHAFASDPRRGVFILLLLSLYTGGALLLFAWRAPQLQGGGLFAPISREGGLAAQQSAADDRGRDGPARHALSAVSRPRRRAEGVGRPALLQHDFCPDHGAAAGRDGDRPDIALEARRSLGGAVSAEARLRGYRRHRAARIARERRRDRSARHAGLGLAAWLFAATLAELADRIGLFDGPVGSVWRRTQRLPRAAWGMTLAHAGMAVVIAGIAGSSSWTEEKIVSARPGQTFDLAGYQIALDAVSPVSGPDHAAIRADMRLLRDGREIASLHPERRTFPNGTATHVAIRTNMLSDVYAVIGEAEGDGAYVLRLYYNPLVPWIWLGAVIMALGGLVSLSDRRHRIGAPARRTRPAAAGCLGPGGGIKRSDRCCGEAGRTCCRWRFSRCWRSGFTAVSRPIRPCCRRR